MLINKNKSHVKIFKDTSEGTFGVNPVVVKVYYGISRTHLHKHTTLPLVC